MITEKPTPEGLNSTRASMYHGAVNPLKRYLGLSLPTKIMIGLLAGIPIGLVLGPRAETLRPVGDLFIRLI